MTSARERLLADGLMKRFIGIQKSNKVNKKIAKWEEHVLDMNEREVKDVAKQIAKKCEIFFQNKERSAEDPSVELMEKKIKEELRKI